MERVFPGPVWDAKFLENSELGRMFAEASAPSPLRDRLSSPKTAEKRFVTLLRTLRAAVTAETQCLQLRADFYFLAAHRDFSLLAGDERLWQLLADRTGVADLRAATARELFLETHIGFLRGYQVLDPTPAPEHRLFRHIAWAERVLPVAGLPEPERAALKAWLRSHEIASLRRLGRVDDALAAHQRALEANSPAAFKDQWIEAVYEHTIAGLKGGESEAELDRDAIVLTSAIHQYVGSLDRIADRTIVYERLADLHRRHIATLATSEDPQLRMAAYQRVVDCDPFDLEVQAQDLHSRFNLADAQKQFRELEQKIAAEGKVLNEEGLRIKSRFENGFSGVQDYLGSSEAAAVQHGIRGIWSCQIWTALGLATSAGWEERSLALTEAIGAALADHDPGDGLFGEALRTEMQSRAELAGLDSTAVESGLRTLKGALPRPAANVEPATPALIDRTQPIVPVSDRSAGGAEDFSHWFFSPQGKVTRWATSAAVALVMLAGGLSAYDWKVTAEREALWPQVIAAARESRLEAVVDLAPKFLSRRPLAGRGDEDRAVQEAYAEALVKLIAQSPSAPAPSILRAAQRYSQLAGEAKEGRP